MVSNIGMVASRRPFDVLPLEALRRQADLVRRQLHLTVRLNHEHHKDNTRPAAFHLAQLVRDLSRVVRARERRSSSLDADAAVTRVLLDFPHEVLHILLPVRGLAVAHNNDTVHVSPIRTKVARNIDKVAFRQTIN